MVRTTMSSLFTLCTLLAAQIHSSEAFTASLPSGGRAVRSKTNTRSIIGFSSTVFAAASDNEAADGSPDKTPPSSAPAETLEFTTDEIQEMEKLILELSKEQNDELRRQKLADILDKELVPPISSTTNSTTNDDNNSSGEPALPQEIPRFARLFQYSLDTIGETVQTAAREKAMELTENSLHVIEDTSTGQFVEGTGPDRIKSEEEMQLWALIDMMVQSKTRVKLYMGSLGSKGAFR